MGDALLHAWTTQYTNSPSTTSAERAPGEPSEASSFKHPNSPIHLRDLEYPPMALSFNREVSKEWGRASMKESPQEYINPNLLSLKDSNDSTDSGALDGLGPFQHPASKHSSRQLPPAARQDALSETREWPNRSRQNETDAGNNASMNIDVLEGVLAELLAFDVVWSQSSNRAEARAGQDEDGMNRLNAHNGFAIGVGWSSTFFPDDVHDDVIMQRSGLH
ncbi:uncharacterized protein DSM5745_09875 [Aspergillus mulundensis]|uniref:Uncharacterized protein n=1 Tax=Aspergillus mulundensis TaxID=1810919 RepID=A0A3D8QSJ5_9EURO|nr:hypothetical protein DSM5745_09875 [Aspergillus mulundensis]RDW64464.1 hypothetical protein DSM5745_09875 [Aspergillus mulundensis]